ncbi:MAG: hypothetical protein R3266_03120 [Gemmatimonadota bacterium]|nr:hypothetical protein [Gemmatimonadota bacterium]
MRRVRDLPTCLGKETGFGLVEVLWAVAVTSLGILAVAGASLTIGETGRLARWSTDRALVARHVLDSLRASGFAGVTAGTGNHVLGPRSYATARSVSSISSLLVEVHLRVSTAGRAPVTFATRLGAPRPLPVAP